MSVGREGEMKGMDQERGTSFFIISCSAFSALSPIPGQQSLPLLVPPIAPPGQPLLGTSRSFALSREPHCLVGHAVIQRGPDEEQFDVPLCAWAQRLV